MSKEPPQRRTLADIIMEKIKDKKTEIESQMSEQSVTPPMDERLIKVFKGYNISLRSIVQHHQRLRLSSQCISFHNEFHEVSSQEVLYNQSVLFTDCSMIITRKK